MTLYNFYTTANQIAAIRIGAEVSDNIIFKNNIFRGENLKVLVEGETEGKNILVNSK